jgi:hypothetical protein
MSKSNFLAEVHAVGLTRLIFSATFCSAYKKSLAYQPIIFAVDGRCWVPDG